MSVNTHLDILHNRLSLTVSEPSCPLINSHGVPGRETWGDSGICVPCSLHRYTVFTARVILHPHTRSVPICLPLVPLVHVAYGNNYHVFLLDLGPNFCCLQVLSQQAQVHDMGDPSTRLSGAKLLFLSSPFMRIHRILRVKQLYFEFRKFSEF